MSLRGFLIASAAAIAIGMSGGAQAQTIAAPIQDLNLRTGPSTGHGIVAVMPAGATVTVHQCSGRWCQVSYGNRTGWASQRYLDMDVAYAPDEVWIAGPEPAWGRAPVVDFGFHIGSRPYYRDWYGWRRPGWYTGWHHPGWWDDRPVGWYGPVYWDRSRWWYDNEWYGSPGFALELGIGSGR